jgi:hypothetical protein
MDVLLTRSGNYNTFNVDEGRIPNKQPTTTFAGPDLGGAGPNRSL